MLPYPLMSDKSELDKLERALRNCLKAVEAYKAKPSSVVGLDTTLNLDAVLIRDRHARGLRLADVFTKVCVIAPISRISLSRAIRAHFGVGLRYSNGHTVFDGLRLIDHPAD